MKKLKNFMKRLRIWQVPIAGAVIFMLLLGAWHALERSAEAATDRFFAGAYEMVDRCLTAYYSNDPDALLAQFPDFALDCAAESVSMDRETLETYVAQTMNEHQVQRAQSGAQYKWECIRWIIDPTDEEWNDATSFMNLISHDIASSHVQRPIEVRITETVGGKTKEHIVFIVMFERDQVWYTDLVHMPWLGEALFQSDGMAPYRAASAWMDAWYNNDPRALLNEIPPVVLDAKPAEDRAAWEKALREQMLSRAKADRDAGIQYSWHMRTSETMPEDAMQRLQQFYRHVYALDVADAKIISLTLWKETKSTNGLGTNESTVTTFHEDDYTVIRIGQTWYIDSLHLPEAFPDIWNIHTGVHTNSVQAPLSD